MGKHPLFQSYYFAETEHEDTSYLSQAMAAYRFLRISGTHPRAIRLRSRWREFGGVCKDTGRKRNHTGYPAGPTALPGFCKGSRSLECRRGYWPNDNGRGSYLRLPHGGTFPPGGRQDRLQRYEIPARR